MSETSNHLETQESLQQLPFEDTHTTREELLQQPETNILAQDTLPQQQPFAKDVVRVFAQLNAEAVAQFYESYQHWLLLQRFTDLQTQVTALQQQITTNSEQMQLIQPTALALASMARFQAYGVDDIDLLDCMLERGETWLDDTLQLLEHCKELGVIGDSYNAWCEHALEGAFAWMASMNGDASESLDEQAMLVEEPVEAISTHTNGVLDDVTEELLLQKLMSDDDTDKYPAIANTSSMVQVADADQAPIEQADDESLESGPVAILPESDVLSTEDITQLADSDPTIGAEREINENPEEVSDEGIAPVEPPVEEFVVTPEETPLPIPEASDDEPVSSSEVPDDALAPEIEEAENSEEFIAQDASPDQVLAVVEDTLSDEHETIVEASDDEYLEQVEPIEDTSAATPALAESNVVDALSMADDTVTQTALPATLVDDEEASTLMVIEADTYNESTIAETPANIAQQPTPMAIPAPAVVARTPMSTIKVPQRRRGFFVRLFAKIFGKIFGR